VLILEAQRCTRISQRYAFDNLGKYKKEQHMHEQNISQ